MSANKSDTSSRKYPVIIIGAGFSGLATGIQLQKLGIHDFLIIEKESDVGGTWRDNTYPGCLSDIPVHFYSLSTELRAHQWQRSCATAPELLAYIKDIVQANNLSPHIRLHTKVTQAKWDPSTQSYFVLTDNLQTRQQEIIESKILVSATGILHVPKMPEISGMDSFKGAAFHTARWDHSIDLTGKRVAIIGNGSTGAGLMSQLPKIKGIQVTNFYRTKNWCLPALQQLLPVPRFFRWLAKHVPGVARLHRWLVFWIIEGTFILNFSALFRRPVRAAAAYWMKKMAPPKYQADIVPDFPVGSRRIIYDDGYMANLNLPNVTLRRNAISEIYPDGIITHDGEKLPFDVIIYATGFIFDHYPTNIIGKDGLSVQEYYDATGGPNAYLGTTLPGFPNFIMMTGPNTATGYSSVNFFSECQLHYVTILIRPILTGVASSFEVTRKATNDYNSKIQKRLESMAFKSATGWYRSGQTGKNVAIFPGSAITFWRWTHTVDWTHYSVLGLKPGVKSLDSGTSVLSIAVVAGAAVLCAIVGICE